MAQRARLTRPRSGPATAQRAPAPPRPRHVPNVRPPAPAKPALPYDLKTRFRVMKSGGVVPLDALAENEVRRFYGPDSIDPATRRVRSGSGYLLDKITFGGYSKAPLDVPAGHAPPRFNRPKAGTYHGRSGPTDTVPTLASETARARARLTAPVPAV